MSDESKPPVLRRVHYMPPPRCSHDAEADSIKTRSHDGSPVALFLQDILVLTRKLYLLPWLVLPLERAQPLPGVPVRRLIRARDWLLLALLVPLEALLLLLYASAAVALPGWLSATIVAGTFALTWALLIRVVWGRNLVLRSTVAVDEERRFEEETWLFINGVSTSYDMALTSTNMLAATFGRPIRGIHNRTYGLLFDLVECLIQRNFHYSTYDVRATFFALHDALSLPPRGDKQPLQSRKKVVVIAHSQGGILVSLALDELYTRLPVACFDALEVYTFGSAAASFHNPVRSSASISRAGATATQTATAMAAASAPHTLQLHDRYVRTVEHYINEFDLVPQWGVLHHMQKQERGAYSGRAFVLKDATGHLFDQHYLTRYFPVERMQADMDAPGLFLNDVVEVGAELEGRSTFLAEVGDRGGGGGDGESRGGGGGRGGEVEVRVRDLSRLWSYVGGGDGFPGGGR